MADELISNLEKLIGERVHRTGMEAYKAGEPRHAPAKFGLYCGDWIRGYDAALYAEMDANLAAT